MAFATGPLKQWVTSQPGAVWIGHTPSEAEKQAIFGGFAQQYGHQPAAPATAPQGTQQYGLAQLLGSFGQQNNAQPFGYGGGALGGLGSGNYGLSSILSRLNMSPSVGGGGFGVFL